MSIEHNDLTPEQQVARDELHDLLQRHAGLLGPAAGDEIEDPPEVVFVEEWVLMVAWTDGDGDSWMTRIMSKGLQNYRRTGLLHEGLYGFGDYD